MQQNKIGERWKVANSICKVVRKATNKLWANK